MEAFDYSAINDSGKLVKGVIEGDSARHVRQQLRSKQLKPVGVSPARGQSRQSSQDRAPYFWEDWFKTRISVSDLALVTRQMAVLLQSSVPVDEVLSATAKQSRKPKVKRLVLHIRSKVMEGHSIAYALGDFPQVFSDMYRAMVHAGEQSGFLGLVLERLADYTENRQYTQQKLKMAMVYPIFLTVVALAVVSILMVMVVPDLVGLFTQTQQELPALTQGLINVSDFFVNWWWTMLLGIVIFVIACQQLLKAPARKRRWHQFVLSVPWINTLVTSLDTARFASTLSILTSSGVPLLEGLRISGQVMSNIPLRESSEQVAERVQEGASMHRALEDAGRFPPLMVQLVASGESSGELDSMLERAALNQERELEMTLDGLMSILAPMMILLMGVVVCVIVMAILLPIFEMNNLVN